MGDSPGDETGCSLNPAEPHPSALWLFPKQRVPQRINRVIFARRIDFFRVARGVNQRGQSANQVRAAAAKDSQASASPAVAQRPDARVSRSSQRAANQAPSQPASTGYPCRIGTALAVLSWRCEKRPAQVDRYTFARGHVLRRMLAPLFVFRSVPN
jgi:hypothetical protein